MKIGVFNLFIDYKTIPILHSFITLTERKNNAIDLFSVGENEKIIIEKNIRHLQFRRVLFNSFSPVILIIKTYNLIKIGNFRYLVSVDPFTIIPVVILGKIFRIKLIYMSLEIFVKRDINNLFFFLYYLMQRYLLRYYDIILIMDESRKELLLENSRLNEHLNKFYFLPNSSLVNNNEHNRSFLYNRLGINNYKKILLIPGEINDQNLVMELNNISRLIDEEYVIVLHSRRKINKNQFSCRFNESEKFRLSLDPVTPLDLDDLYSSAYIGLCLYKIAKSGTMALNLYHIGKASGKLNNFLKLGIPVIMSPLPYFKKLEQEYQCGCCLESINDLNEKVKFIKMNYDQISKNAKNCFNKEMYYESAFEQFYKSIS